MGARRRRPVRACRPERLTRLRVGPLTFGAFQSAVRATAGAGLSLLTIRRLFDASDGNPFYGLELARAMQRAGGEPSPEDPLPVPADLEGVLSARLAALPAVQAFARANPVSPSSLPKPKPS